MKPIGRRASRARAIKFIVRRRIVAVGRGIVVVGRRIDLLTHKRRRINVIFH